MLIYVLRWRPSWISNQQKKQKLGKGHSNDHSFTVWVQSVHLASVVRGPLSVVCKLFTFQASSPKPLGRLEPNLAGMFLGWSSTKLLFFVPVGYSIWLPRPIIFYNFVSFYFKYLDVLWPYDYATKNYSIF
jgi:hypothetical protein